jgi:hypothetical protein
MDRAAAPAYAPGMASRMNVVAFDVSMRDMYALPGTQLKQWVVDARREAAWERDTCPLVLTETHNDNTGIQCRNSGAAQWMHLEHDCCSECDDLHEATRTRPDVVAWLASRERYRAEHPICEDRDRLSDEVQADLPSIRENSFIKALNVRKEI